MAVQKYDPGPDRFDKLCGCFVIIVLYGVLGMWLGKIIASWLAGR